jgi:hypothetical protein
MLIHAAKTQVEPYYGNVIIWKGMEARARQLSSSYNHVAHRHQPTLKSCSVTLLFGGLPIHNRFLCPFVMFINLKNHLCSLCSHASHESHLINSFAKQVAEQAKPVCNLSCKSAICFFNLLSASIPNRSQNTAHKIPHVLFINSHLHFLCF